LGGKRQTSILCGMRQESWGRFGDERRHEGKKRKSSTTRKKGKKGGGGDQNKGDLARESLRFLRNNKNPPHKRANNKKTGEVSKITSERGGHGQIEKRAQHYIINQKDAGGARFREKKKTKKGVCNPVG